MAGMGDRLWDIGRSPAQHMTVLVFGLLALLTGIVATSILAVAGGGGGATSIIMAALILRGVGGVFVTLAPFVAAGEELARVRPDVDSDGVRGVHGHPLSQHAHVRAGAGQSLCVTTPRLAAARRLPHGHLTLREHTVLGTDQRGDERGVFLLRMRGDRESELGR